MAIHFKSAPRPFTKIDTRKRFDQPLRCVHCGKVPRGGKSKVISTLLGDLCGKCRRAIGYASPLPKSGT